MNYIVFDLEWNQCPYGKERENKKLPFEIIEIGALKLDENRRRVDSFHQVVKPAVYKKLHYRTKEILDIKGSDLEKGIPFPAAVKNFMKWCGPEAKFCTWGSSDLVELQRNMKFYQMLNLLKGPVFYYDIQKLFGLVYEGKRTSRSLESAIEYLDMEKEGEFHRALNDAFYTAEIFAGIPLETAQRYYSIDCYQNPKSRRDQICADFPEYSKFISREFSDKEEAMRDRDVTATRCFVCGRTARKKIRWFSVNAKAHVCLAFCPAHGYFQGKARLKKTDEGRYYVVKTLKRISAEDAEHIREKRDALRKKRRKKRHQENKKDKGGEQGFYESTRTTKRK